MQSCHPPRKFDGLIETASRLPAAAGGQRNERNTGRDQIGEQCRKGLEIRPLAALERDDLAADAIVRAFMSS